MSISIGVGLTSGINYEDIINQISAASRRPIQNLQIRQTDLQAKSGALLGLNTRLLSLNDALTGLKNMSGLESIQAESSDSDILGLSAGANADLGSYSVKVTQLAQNQRLAALGVDSLDTVIGGPEGGQFRFQIGDNPAQSIAIAPDMTLRQLRDAINAQTEGLSASIINDGASSNSYRLTLSVDATGAANTLNVLQNDTTLALGGVGAVATSADHSAPGTSGTSTGAIATGGAYTGTEARAFLVQISDTGGASGEAQFRYSTDNGATWSAMMATGPGPIALEDGVEIRFGAGDYALGEAFTFNAAPGQVLQQAQDARIEVNGIGITNASNSFSNVIEGVTFQAKAVSESAVTASVTRSRSGVDTAIQKFVGAYNEVITAIQKETFYDSESNKKGTLFADSTVSSIKNALALSVTSLVAGLDPNGLSALSRIGITVTKTGLLSVDQTMMNKAIAENFDDVVALFSASGSKGNSALEFLSASATSVAPGDYTVHITQAAQQATVTAGVAMAPEGLTAAERLTFNYGGKEIAVALEQGDTLATAISRINNAMRTEGMALTAYESEGRLAIRTGEYGSSESFWVQSDTGETGLGTVRRTGRGVDVQGTINGHEASGIGQTLSGAYGTPVNGLRLRVTATEPGALGAITVRFGVAESLSKTLQGITNSRDGLIKARTDGLNATMELNNERISLMESRIIREAERMRAQFNSLELQLTEMRSQGDYLLNQLQSLSAYNMNNNRR